MYTKAKIINITSPDAKKKTNHESKFTQTSITILPSYSQYVCSATRTQLQSDFGSQQLHRVQRKRNKRNNQNLVM